MDPVNEFYGSLGEQSAKTTDVYGRHYTSQGNEYQQQPQKYQTPNYSYSNSQVQQQQQYSRSVSNGHQRSSGPSIGFSSDYPSNNIPETQQTQQARQQVRNSGVLIL